VKPKFLFVCVENSCRSQIAEAFARMLGASDVEAFSAGSRPTGLINPRAIEAMAELGYDLSTHRSMAIDDLPRGPYAAVVTMGCGDACPHLPADRREDWPIPDPAELSPEDFRLVRDEIRTRVARLMSDAAAGS
jgi:protein-tyrosine-phosphatase